MCHFVISEDMPPAYQPAGKNEEQKKEVLTKFDALKKIFEMREKIADMRQSFDRLDGRICFELQEIQVQPGNPKIGQETSEYLNLTVWAMGLFYDQVQELAEEAQMVEYW